ncbi:MAG: hypothetical protein MUO23_02380 [Anaerolineales bacterium]|nr:hypothetical protein [Anaerolineales bacterium]
MNDKRAEQTGRGPAGTGAPKPGAGDGAQRPWLAFIAIGLFFTLVAAYFVSHKPFTPANVFAIASTTRDVLLAGALVAVAGGIGRRLLPTPHASSTASLSLQAAFGLGVMGLGSLFVGWWGGARASVAWVGLLALGLAFGRSALRWCSGWRSSLRALAQADPVTQAAVACAGMLLGLAFLEAAAPPVHFDALVYHLELPRRFLAQGSFGLTPQNPYWGLPLLGEALYTWALALGRLQTAAVLGWMAAGLTLAGVFGLAASWAKPAGWAGLLALIGGASLCASPGWAYVDWWAALYGMALLVVLDMYRATPARSLAALGGLMAGFACGVKYTAWLALPAGFFAFWSADRSRRGLRHAVLFALGGALIAWPWVWKNLQATGAPLYPYVGASAWIQPERQAALRESVAPPSAGLSLGAPVAATFLGHEQAPGFASDIGPLLVGLLPGLALLRRGMRPRLVPTGVFLLVGWGIWAAASMASGLLIQTRLYFVLLPAWAVLAGAGFAGFEASVVGKIRLGRLAGALVALVVGLLLFQQLRTQILARPAAVLLGEEAESSYLLRRLGGFYVTQLRIQELAEGSRVLMLWEPRGLYCSPRCVPDPWIDRWYVDRRTIGGAEEILERWRSDTITHVLVFEAGMDFVRKQDARYSEQDWQALDTALDEMALVESIGDGYNLYELP